MRVSEVRDLRLALARIERLARDARDGRGDRAQVLEEIQRAASAALGHRKGCVHRVPQPDGSVAVDSFSASGRWRGSSIGLTPDEAEDRVRQLRRAQVR